MEKQSLELKRIGALSVGKIMGLVYGIIGLIMGAIFSCVSLVGAAAMAGMFDEPIIGALFGLGAIIMMPIFYGVMGFIMGLILATIYNVVAGKFGGIEMELV